MQFRTNKCVDYIVGYRISGGQWKYLESPEDEGSVEGNYLWATIPIPQNEITTFEIRVVCGIFNAGLTNRLILID